MTIKSFTLEDIDNISLVAYMVGIEEYWCKVTFKGCTKPVDYRAVSTGDALSQALVEAINAKNYGEPRHGLGATLEDGSDGFRTQPKSQEELEADIRAQRDQLLLTTDWTDTTAGQSRLTSEQKTAYSSYREALRNITNQATFPWEPIWPVKPA
jgi:Phage tail assembly chaperone protein